MAKILDEIQLFQRDMMIKSLALKGFGANKTLKAIQDAGLPMRRQDLLRTYAEYAQIPQKADRIKFVPKNYQIGQQMYTEPYVTPTGRPAWMSRTYRYTVEFTTFNPDSGETRLNYNSMISDSALTPSQIESNFINSLQGSIDKYKLTLVKYNIAIAEHRPGDPWD